MSVSFVRSLDAQRVRDLQLELDQFVLNHSTDSTGGGPQRPLALVTSGGTATDLEVNAVRSLDNFSTGLRGSMAVEQLLASGYAVVHLQRTGSAAPYARVLGRALGLQQANHGLSIDSLGKLFGDDQRAEQEEDLVKLVLDKERDPWLSKNTPDVPADDDDDDGTTPRPLRLHKGLLASQAVRTAIADAQQYQDRILTINFRTVEEYLGLLELSARGLADAQARVMVVLAAAVSDFYIPHAEKAVHKIQSSSEGSTGKSSSGDNAAGLVLNLRPVPKCLGLLRSTWCPHALIVSFKLETDHTLLRRKAERAITKYGCHAVIGNLLATRHEKVWVLQQPMIPAAASASTPSRTDPSGWDMDAITKPVAAHDPDALEVALADRLVQIHLEFISWQQPELSTTLTQRKSHFHLDAKRRSVNRRLLWRQIQQVAVQCAVTGLACYLSWKVSSQLQQRLEAASNNNRSSNRR